MFAQLIVYLASLYVSEEGPPAAELIIFTYIFFLDFSPTFLLHLAFRLQASSSTPFLTFVRFTFEQLKSVEVALTCLFFDDERASNVAPTDSERVHAFQVLRRDTSRRL